MSWRVARAVTSEKVIARKTSLGAAKFLILLNRDSSSQAPFCMSKIPIDGRRLLST
jgi:hypothetical protein